MRSWISFGWPAGVWVYAVVLVGVTAVAVIQLNRLRSHQHPEISPEALQAAADSGQATVRNEKEKLF